MQAVKDECASMLESLFSACSNPLCIADKNGIILMANEAMHKYAGALSDALVSKNLFELVKGAQATLDTGNSFIETKDGISTSWDVFEDSERIYASARDFTKSLVELDRITTERDDAQRASHAKGQFLANMSHEIRTPMNGILGFLQLLESTALTALQREYVNNMKISSQLLHSTLNDILDISRIEARGTKLEVSEFNLYTTIEEALIPFTAIAYGKGLDLNLYIEPAVPEFVMGDAVKLKQVVSNLLSNAVKFTEQGTVLVEAILQGKSSDNDEVNILIKIHDTGIGISSDTIKTLFSPFSQGDNEISRKYGGSGLGLVISKSIATAMNGKVDIDSTEGSGTVVSFSLTLLKSTQSNAQEDFSNLQGKTLLIISEENEDIHILRRYLELEGVNILQVASGTQGIVSLVDCRENNKRNCNIDAVLIARELPDMKAWDLLAALRAISATKELPLALITSRLSHDNESSSSSFTARINKPFRKRELLHTISDMLKEKEITLPEQSSLMRSNDSIMEQGSGYKLLIVEDNEINYQFLSKYLMTKGFRCDVAVNGKDAVEAFKKQKYDLIFMDCQMPVMDGFEATKQIRRIQGEGAHTPIIAMTAYSLESDDKKCFAAGMDEFISKPVDVNKINKILDKYSIVNKNKDEAYEEMERQLSHEMLSPGRRQRVLIVDDMPTNISLLAAALDEDYDIRVATSGREALVLAHSTNPPDIILLDIRMPDLDGYEVFSKLSNEADTRDIPVIFLTGICEAQSEEYGLKLGAIDYIKKPFSIPIVKAKIKNHLELKQYKDFLRENTWLDQLTQIANRRRFDEMWALEVKRSKRLGSFLSLLMIDIDKFKDYNDTYGHLQGDECLRRVAAVIKSTARRPGDLAARWGGEEFLCLLPDTDPKGAREIAERTRQAVLDLGLEHSATDIGIVTVSVGVVTSDAECENCYDELIKRVDSALYHAKESGRNRVSMWGEF